MPQMTDEQKVAAEEATKDREAEDAAREAAKAAGKGAKGKDVLVIVRDGVSYGGVDLPKGTEIDPEQEWVRRGILPYMDQADPIARSKSVVTKMAELDKLRAEAEKDMATLKIKSNPG